MDIQQQQSAATACTHTTMLAAEAVAVTRKQIKQGKNFKHKATAKGEG